MADRFLALLALAMAAVASMAVEPANWDQWRYVHATFYGDITGDETIELSELRLISLQTDYAQAACYELTCYNSTWCLPGAGSVKVTATIFCASPPPPNWSIPSDAGGWCNSPRRHFDLSMPMFLRIARYRGGIVPVKFRRIPCIRHVGIKFEMGGNNHWTSILVYNVGGNGVVAAVGVRTAGSREFTPLKRNWGQLWNWPDYSSHLGEGMSIRVTTSDGKLVFSDNVVPANWQVAQTFEGSQF